jgi:hypothetical protein
MKTLNTLFLSIGILAFAHTAFAKRMAPTVIAAITTKRGVIQHSFERSNIGFNMYVLMKDKAGDLRWKTKIFGRKYEKNLETDVQDIHLRSLVLDATNAVELMRWEDDTKLM